MIGTLRWNIIVGLVGFTLTFALSVSRNYMSRALLQGFYSFIILFAVVFALRWIMGTLIGLKGVAPQAGEDRGHIGQAVNEATPDDRDELNGMLKEQLNRSEPDGDDSFVPLQPQKLATVSETEPEQLAQALRHLKEK
ncbi:hypothetical protein ACFFNY_24455 [Paenibacillus hodogayensis]|uniref:Uncharacterized protein n=1 Tax=Paenibacillus hodogayensis TaxID=279208 RepID=A0ABV5W2H9_9BACL